MRIGIDIREFEKGKMTGIGRYLRQFLSFVAENDKENEYILFGNQRTEYIPLSSNQKICTIQEGMTVVWDQILLPRALKREKTDVFLTPYFKAPVYCPCTLVVIVNDLTPLVLPGHQTGNSFLKRLYFKQGLAMASKRADRLITISQHTKDDLIRLFHVPDNKVDVVHLAVDPAYQELNGDKEKVSERYQIRGKFIFYAGNLKAHKNVAGLVEAYAQLPPSIRKEYQLVLGAQKDFCHAALSQRVEELGLQEQIVFTGHIPEEDLPRLYNEASLFVFPSLYEGFGLPVLEAMACGVPVVTSNAGSLSEVGKDAAVCFDPQDSRELSQSMEKVLTDSSLREGLIQKGLRRASEFTIKKMGTRFYEILIHC